MKILIPSRAHQYNVAALYEHRRTRNDGFVAVIVMLILLGLVLTFITANLLALTTLRGDMKVVERKQLERLAHISTNATPVSLNVSGINSPAPSK